jgi:hypothetical protein
MGFWFFLSVIVSGNLIFKAYKLRMLTRDHFVKDHCAKLERDIKALKETLEQRDLEKRVASLEENVYFGDFELKRKFTKLEQEYHKNI